MLDLTPQSACDGLLPLQVDGATLIEVAPAHVTALAPFRGQAKALSQALHQAHGLRLPNPGRATSKGGVRALWAGLDQVLVLSDAPLGDLTDMAAVTDQSDAWATVQIKGPLATEILARVTPLDLSAAQFKRGAVARSLVQHVNVVLTRVGPRAFEIMCLWSFAGSLVHDLDVAMRSVAALQAQG